MGIVNDSCFLHGFDAALPAESTSVVHVNGFHEPSPAINGFKSSVPTKDFHGTSSSSLCSSSSSVDDEENDRLFPSSSNLSSDLDTLEGGGASMEGAVKVLLSCLDEDVNRNGLLKTPVRVARAFAFATKGYRQVAEDIVRDALFPETGAETVYGFAGGFGGMVVVRNIDLFSLCEACLLPFKICCHIAYISSGLQVVGLSKLSRVADMYARRLQNPQRLACEISQGLEDSVKPLGVGVLLQSYHLPVPGVSHYTHIGPKDIFQYPLLTFAKNGQFCDHKSDAWSEFLSILLLEGIRVGDLDGLNNNLIAQEAWCPVGKMGLEVDTISCDCVGNCCANKDGANRAFQEGKSSLMAASVETILCAIGENTSRKGLLLTPKRFASWLMNFVKDSQEAEISSAFQADHCCLKPLLPSQVVYSMDNGCVDTSISYELDVYFCSLCEHHLLPFYGKAHVGYVTSGEALDRTSISNIVEVASKRLQVQERLTKEIAEAIARMYDVQNVIVILEASHICMVSRGVEKLGSSTATVAVFGSFATDAAAKAQFLKVISGRCSNRISDDS